MNRVRIVAISAVALGAAVVAGTQFQQSSSQPAPDVVAQDPDAALAQAQAYARSVAPAAETSLAALGTADQAPAAAPSNAAQPAADAATRSVAPQMASILPGDQAARPEPPRGCSRTRTSTCSRPIAPRFGS